MQSSAPTINIIIQKTQFQTGTTDCGVYSIAFATDLAHGNNPASYRQKQDCLRSHLATCIANNRMPCFPSTEVRAEKPVKKEHVKLYCKCRLPYDEVEKMAQCVECKKRYRQSCENIPQSIFKDRKAIWKCSTCVSIKP